MIDPDDWAVQAYDEIVAEGGGETGLPLDDTADRFVDRYVKALRSRTIQRPQPDDRQEAKNLFNRIVRPARDRRSRKLVGDMEFILDAVADPENGATLLGKEDPLFMQAHRLGTKDGRDKVLGTWTIEDFRNVALVRYDQSAEAVAAAARFNELQRTITDVMRERGAATVWALFESEA
jgi:hypothetical protein